MDAGGYLLIIRLQRRVTVRVGRLGEMDFHRGWYVYAGSAMRGLRARVERHAGRRKRIHWHIDYLLACPAAQLVECLIFPSANRVECRLNRQVLGLDGAGAGPHGFGSTDCMEGCPAHLVYFRQKPDLDHMREFAPRLKEQ
ncbi:MAG TPA: GIY-YIG nuclease family protein [Planctomycetota bacterium]|nr:GIY-YIG nuclease family protein [Planctomycetota bacterium]